MQAGVQTDYTFFLEHAKKIDSIWGDTLYTEEIVAPGICDSEIAPLFAALKRPIYWERIKRKLQCRYSTLSPRIIPIEQELFERQIELEVKQLTYNDSLPIDWTAVEQMFTREYPKFNIRPVVLHGEIDYFAMKKMWKECSAATDGYLRRYRSKLKAGAVNELIWEKIFNHSDDKKALEDGIRWMRSIIPNTNQTANHLSGPEQAGFLKRVKGIVRY